LVLERKSKTLQRLLTTPVGPVTMIVGHVLPTAWAMEGFQNLVLRGLGLSAVLLPAGLLLAYAAAFFGLAVWRFRFE
jgi:ABC-2 type transport system permease protein